MTWSLAGKYPRILEDEVVGVEAQRLFKDANDMLDKLSAEKLLNPRGVVGLFPANRVGDDIEIYRDETRTHVLTVSHHLRQQTEKVGFANYCLADFVAPKLSGKADYIGAFAVTGGGGGGHRDEAHRIFRHVARRVGLRLVLQPS